MPDTNVLDSGLPDETVPINAGRFRILGGLRVASAEEAAPPAPGLLRAIRVSAAGFEARGAAPAAQAGDAAPASGTSVAERARAAGAAGIFVAPADDGYERWRSWSPARDAAVAALRECGLARVPVLFAPRPGTADVLPLKRVVAPCPETTVLLDSFAHPRTRDWQAPARLARFDNVHIRTCGLPDGPSPSTGAGEPLVSDEEVLRWAVGELGSGKLLFASTPALAPAPPVERTAALEFLAGRGFLAREDLELILIGNALRLWPTLAETMRMG